MTAKPSTILADKAPAPAGACDQAIRSGLIYGSKVEVGSP